MSSLVPLTLSLSRRVIAICLGVLLCSGAISGCASIQRPDGGSGPLLRGNAVPTLTALDQRGQPVRVGDNMPHPTVVYFYPSDGTPGCTAEACAFRDVWKLYQQAGITVVGVSNDDRTSHAQFAKEQNLPFSLVADTDGTWGRAFGVSRFAGFYSRITFLVAANGVVLKTYDDIDPGIHAKQILADAQLANRPASPQSHVDVLAPAPLPRLLPAPTVHLQLRASAPVVTETGSRKFWLGATLTPPAGSHLYWKHTGETGLATRVEFSGPEGFEIADVQYPGPSRFTSQRGQIAYGYSAPVTLVAEVATNNPTIDGIFRVHGSWLSCDVSCVKEEGWATVAGNNDSFEQPFDNVNAVLRQLPQPSTALGITLSFDASTRILKLSPPNDRRVTVLDVFPEQDLGPDERVPLRLETTVGFQRWQWRAITPPSTVLVSTANGDQRVFYRLQR